LHVAIAHTTRKIIIRTNSSKEMKSISCGVRPALSMAIFEASTPIVVVVLLCGGHTGVL